MIMMVEDSPEDVEAARRVLTQLGLADRLKHFWDGESALTFLHQFDQNDRRPELILLDLNLPGAEGRDVLAEIKSHPNLRSIPVVVFTSSDEPADIEACYARGANSYIRKPIHLEGFRATLRQLSDYWLNTVSLPAR